MKTVITARDIDEWVARGQSLSSLPGDSLLTPSAKDRLLELNRAQATATAPASSTPVAGTAPAAAVVVNSKSSPAALEAFFNSAPIHALKEQICDVGRRLWSRNYVDGNGGNIAIRVGEDIALCTPTLVSKGFMKPSDICLVDLEGKQLAGVKKRTSEILMHLEIMKRQPRAKATVHCHPPHATAYAVAGVEPPTCMIPEIEVFIGRVPIAPYRTPGTPEMGKLVGDLVDQHNTVLMGNHGAVAWSHNDVEDGYFKMEILEAYCRTIWVASQLGQPLKTFSKEQLKDLLRIKQGLGIPDPRIGMKEAELCDNNEWRPGVSCGLASKNAAGSTSGPDPEAEKLVQSITEQILAGIAKG